MKKDNIKKLAIVVAATVMVSGLALALNGNLNKLGKIKSSVIDPINGNSCSTEIYEYNGEFEPQAFQFLNIDPYSYDYVEEHTTGYTISDIEMLQSRSQTHCPNGYKCENKPQITPMEVDDPDCTTISSDDVYGYGNDSVQKQLEDLYEAYNHPDFCPNNYCVPETYEINLDYSGDFGGTVVSTGTTKIYEKFNTAFYLDENATQEMTINENAITTPEMTVSVTYDGNSQGASYVGSPTAVQTPFNRYAYENTQYPYYEYIDENGFNYFLDNKMYYDSSYYGDTYVEGYDTLNAVYGHGDLVLPTITKTDHICYWNIDSEKNTYEDCTYSQIVDGSGEVAYDTNYNFDPVTCLRGGRTVKIQANVVATAMCLYKPTFTVNYNGNGGTGTTASHTCVHDEACNLSSNGFSRSGYIFLGWKKENAGDTLQPGASITNVVTSGTVTYYAQWKQVDGTTKSFSANTNCTAQTYTAPSAGTYLLEVCGAQGAGVSYSNISQSGGLGGCAKGKVSLSAGQTIYVFVGKQGTSTSAATASGGCNGGGNSSKSNYTWEYVGSGGGATHISKTNSSIANAGNNLLIVGGGGGGAYLYINNGGFDFGGNGGNGGGSSGSSGSSDTSDGSWKASAGGGGTQNGGGSVGGSKGQGGLAGGGGYYGGGAAKAQPIIGGEDGRGAGAGGGSGYVGGVSSSSWTSSCANSGNYKTGDGCAKVTKQ